MYTYTTNCVYFVNTIISPSNPTIFECMAKFKSLSFIQHTLMTSQTQTMNTRANFKIQHFNIHENRKCRIETSSNDYGFYDNLFSETRPFSYKNNKNGNKASIAQCQQHSQDESFLGGRGCLAAFSSEHQAKQFPFKYLVLNELKSRLQSETIMYTNTLSLNFKNNT